MGLRHNLSAILGQVNIPRVQENERLNEGSITDISHINSVAGPTFLLLSHVNWCIPDKVLKTNLNILTQLNIMAWAGYFAQFTRKLDSQ